MFDEVEKMVNQLRKTPLSVLTVGFLTAGAVIAPYNAQADMLSADKFSIYGDFRLRFEADWDYKETRTGKTKDDRNRARIRARVGMKYQPTENFEYGARLRSGSDGNHLSPHITIVDFESNNTGAADFNFDKWFLKAKSNGLWGWVGRNSLPFWKQNEMFWDDDAIPTGIAAGYDMKFGASQLALNAGYLSPPVGMHAFTGHLGIGQIVFSTKLGENQVTAAGGLLAFEANADKDGGDAALLWDGNGGRDYSIWIGSLQGKFNVGLPLTVGLDWMHNAEDYSAKHVDTICIDPNDPAKDKGCSRSFTANNHDETDGYVFSIKLGKLKDKGDWLLGYHYAHIETFAVNSSYAQDDWGRWDPQSSNMKGHELRAAYKPIKMLSIVARIYMLETITGTNKEGNRFRLDFNYKF